MSDAAVNALLCAVGGFMVGVGIVRGRAGHASAGWPTGASGLLLVAVGMLRGWI